MKGNVLYILLLNLIVILQENMHFEGTLPIICHKNPPFLYRISYKYDFDLLNLFIISYLI